MPKYAAPSPNGVYLASVLRTFAQQWLYPVRKSSYEQRMSISNLILQGWGSTLHLIFLTGFTAPRNRSVRPVRDSMLMVETCGKLHQKKVFSNEVNTTDSVPPNWRLAEFIPHNTMYLCGAHRQLRKACR